MSDLGQDTSVNDIAYLGGHVLATSAIASTFVTNLPTYIALMATIAALIWYVIQILESHTVRDWLTENRTKKIARLKAQLTRFEADDTKSE